MPDQPRPRRLAMDHRLESVARAGHAVREFAMMAGLDDMAAGDLELATVEAANNILIHGFGGSADARYRVAVRLSAGEVQVLLTDAAAPVPETVLTQASDWNAEMVSARGVAIIRACCDRVEYRRRHGRNHLLLGKRLPS